MRRTLVLAILLIAAAVLAWFQETTPKPLPADAPPAAFSAGRAMADVRVIARTPHPVGSDANRAVRDHLLRRMSTLGLAPQVQRATAFEAHAMPNAAYLAGGVVENVIGVLPGRDRTSPAVAIMAHYDSVPGSPGAADDATGVASALEIVRALKVQGQPARDVILVITDGEEAGLLGARAFFRDHPLSKRIGFVLNMEARGGGGRVQMFQTGPRAGEAAALFQRSAVRPASNSLSSFVYEMMPNDTDFTISKDAGILGLNYAFIGRQFDYHAPASTPANLDQGSLQDMGQQVLAAAREAAFTSALPKPAPDLVYSEVVGSWLIAYPPAVGWLVLAAALGLFVTGIVRARREGGFAVWEMARGFAAGLFVLVGSAAVLGFARQATGVAFGFLEQRRLLAQVTLFEIALVLLALGFLLASAIAVSRGRRAFALLPLAAGAGASLFNGFDPVSLGLGVAASLLGLAAFWRPSRRPGAWAGVLLTGFVVGVALQVFAPTTAFIAAWPLLFAAVAAAASALGARPSRIAIAVLALYPLLLAARLAHGLHLGLDMPAALGAPLWIAALALWPLVHPRPDGTEGRLPAVTLLVAGLVVLTVVRFQPPWTARHPDVAVVHYLVDLDAGRSFRVSATPHRNAWIDQVLTADGGGAAKRPLRPLYSRPVDASPARAVTAATPQITLSKQADGGLVLTVAPTPGVSVLALDLTATTPMTATFEGRSVPILGKADQRATVRWATAQEPFALHLKPAGAGRLDLTFAAVTPTWPTEAKALPARPATVSGFDLSDSTVVKGSRRFTW